MSSADNLFLFCAYDYDDGEEGKNGVVVDLDELFFLYDCYDEEEDKVVVEDNVFYLG